MAADYDKTQFFKAIQRASNVPRTDAPKNKPNKRTADTNCFLLNRPIVIFFTVLVASAA